MPFPPLPSITRDTTRAICAEFLATALFVFVGAGTAVSSQGFVAIEEQTLRNFTLDVSFITAVSLAFGIAITVLVYTIAPISGGHINPAVTLAFVLLGKMHFVIGALYVVAQFLGAWLGAAVVWGSTESSFLGGPNNNPPFRLGSNVLVEEYPVGSAFLIESVGTFLLVWTVMMTAVHPKSIANNIAPIAIGGSVLLAHLVMVPFTGCGINPARSFGPHVVTSLAGVKINTTGLWVYYIAPFVGSAVAAFTAKFIFDLDKVEAGETVDEDDAAVEKDVVELQQVEEGNAEVAEQPMRDVSVKEAEA